MCRLRLTVAAASFVAFSMLAIHTGLTSIAWADQKGSKTDGTHVAGNKSVDQYIRKFKGRGATGNFATKPKSPEETRKLFELAPGLEVSCVLHEPVVSQPLFMNFDARGRMWVMQYLQYPFPAGLKVVKYDKHLRAIFDKKPHPPGHPKHVAGKDKITIHEDTNGDGVYDKHKTFIDGLNIATSFAHDYQGVWVLNPPYLLYYEDLNQDDVPDGEPYVMLDGFGLEDTHAVANSLRWGPDGWLYGAQGSTCTASVVSVVANAKVYDQSLQERILARDRREPIHFKGQAIWRFHPKTKQFEVFAEGGGNTFAVEFDSKGRLFSGTNHGSVRGVHYVQGGRYIKNWGKHGPLMNPYSFGYFQHMKHEGYKPRFSHAFTIYEGGAMPQYEGKMISIIPLHQRVQVSDLIPDGSTYRTKDTHTFATNKDTWFRPVAIAPGPDGAIYLADWYDTRLTHVDPRDNWDKKHGRIWRIAKKGTKPRKPFDFNKEKTADLVKNRLSSKNRWDRETASRIISPRPERQIPIRVEGAGLSDDAAKSLAIYMLLQHKRGLEDFSRLKRMPTIKSAVEHERRWAIHMLGDKPPPNVVSDADLILEFSTLANFESAPQVRSQLASTAKRLDAKTGLAIAATMILSGKDDKDPHTPLLLWWAVEHFATTNRDEILEKINTKEIWQTHIGGTIVLPRLAQRYASEPTKLNLISLAKLLDAAPDLNASKALLASIESGFQGQVIGQLPPQLRESLAKTIGQVRKNDPDGILVLRMRTEDPTAMKAARALVLNDDPKVKSQRIEVINILGEIGHASVADDLIKVALASKWHSVRRAALGSLQRFGGGATAAAIIHGYNQLPTDQGVREAAIDMLTTRKSWSLSLLNAIKTGQPGDMGKISRTDVLPRFIERMRLHDSDDITKLIYKHYGFIRATPNEIKQQMLRVAKVLSVQGGQAKPDPKAGKVLFTNTCFDCHKLHNEGKSVGPDLTGYERTNLDFMLQAIIDPSAGIREEYINYIVRTIDGRVVTGFLLDQSTKTITMQDALGGAGGGKVVIPRGDIDDMRASKVSRMPQKLLDKLTDKQIRDLFAYLTSN